MTMLIIILAKRRQVHFSEMNYAALPPDFDALPLVERALAIDKAAYGDNHPSTATSLNNLAVFHAEQGEWEKALPLMERAVQIRLRALGEAHPDTQTGMRSLQRIQEHLRAMAAE